MACLVLAFVSLVVVLTVVDLSIHQWPRSEALTVDGSEHRLRLPDHESAMVWVYAGDNTPRCRFKDAETSTPLRTRPSDQDYLRPAGSGGGYRGEHVIDSGSGRVIGTCSSRGATSPVYLERAPRLPPYLDGLGWPVLIPLVLALVGVLLLVRGLVAFARRPRPR